MSVFGAQALAVSTSQQGGVNKDLHVEMADPPTDSVSSMSFSRQANFLAVGSWDNTVRIYLIDQPNLPRLGQVRIYEIGTDGHSRSKVVHHHQGPVLSVCWNKVSNFFSM